MNPNRYYAVEGTYLGTVDDPTACWYVVDRLSGVIVKGSEGCSPEKAERMVGTLNAVNVLQEILLGCDCG